ncbi:uncharacterized protein LOC135428817 [Drosophila montana]
METDDIVEVWKHIPYKDTLSYYGVGAGIQSPEAVVFNQVILKCLDDVKPEAAAVKIPRKTPIPAKPQKNQTHGTNPWGALVLNRQLLSSKINQMPVVQRKVYPMNVGFWLHGPRPTMPEYPFLESQPKVPLTSALDMEQPAPKRKHGLRRKHMYCEFPCNIEENMCTDYEWQKYKEDPKPYEVAFENEMAQVEEEKIFEPRNYDELYSELLTCFEQDTNADSIRDLYNKCCKGISEHGQDDLEGGPHGGGNRGRRHEDEDAGEGSDFGSDGKTAGENEGKRKGKGERKGKDKGERGGKSKAGGKGGAGEKGIKEHVPRQNLMVPDGEGSMPDGAENKLFEKIDGGSDSSLLRKEKVPKIEKQRKKTNRRNSRGLTKKPYAGKKKSCTRVSKTEVPKECPCEICKLMNRQDEPDTPFIRQMKQEEKRRQNRDYYKQMCHREYLKWRKPEYHAPQHKSDGIVCDNNFCQNPKLGEYCECLDAMQKLQKLLGPKHRIVKNELMFNVEDLKRRICRHLCDCLK